MKQESSRHEYTVQLNEQERHDLLDQLSMARYYIQDLDNDTVAGRLKKNDELTDFFDGLWNRVI